jgi:hypothetical protein
MNKKTAVVSVGVLVAVGLLWFGGVDRVQYEEDCLDCQLSRTVHQVRIATSPIRESTEERPSLLSLVAEDLGVTCPHAQVHRWLAGRRLGLVFLVFEDHVLHPMQRPWYPPCARDSARALAESEPGLPSEFRSRIIADHDWGYWAEVRSRIFESCPPDQRPGAFAPESPSPPAGPTPGDADGSGDSRPPGDESAPADEPG